MARLTLDPARPPRLSAETRATMKGLSDAEITAAAKDDPDNPPLTEAELDRLRLIQLVRHARARTGLSQARFASAFHINLGRLRDLEQGRSRPDSALAAYLTVIARDPDGVRAALTSAEVP